MDKPVRNETDAHVARFERFQKEAHEPAWMTSLRRAGMARFSEAGFPTLRDEDWRFTNVAPITRLPFKPAFELVHPALTPQAIAGFTFGRLPANRLVFINGRYAAELSQVEAQPPGIGISSLAAVLATNPAALEQHLARHEPDGNNAFAALNTAFFQDGAFIHVAPARPWRRPFTCCLSRPRRRRAQRGIRAMSSSPGVAAV